MKIKPIHEKDPRTSRDLFFEAASICQYETGGWSLTQAKTKKTKMKRLIDARYKPIIPKFEHLNNVCFPACATYRKHGRGSSVPCILFMNIYITYLLLTASFSTGLIMTLRKKLSGRRITLKMLAILFILVYLVGIGVGHLIGSIPEDKW